MVDNRAERILLCGWGETRFMTTLLRELDHGSSALPKGAVDCVLCLRESVLCARNARLRASTASSCPWSETARDCLRHQTGAAAKGLRHSCRHGHSSRLETFGTIRRLRVFPCVACLPATAGAFSSTC